LTGPSVDPVADVPIGRPLAHATAHVLAFDGSLAPLGAEGTLHIGGPAVTRGYLHQPEATAEVFCPDPFGSAGARLYNTGDRARWRPDGALDFLGRRDRQVKLRGQRIDLGEIERALGQFDGVVEARVAIDAAGTDAARLIAWVTGPEMAEGRPVPAGLVENVARHMSGATRPLIVPVSGFPLKPNGKVDMAALPRPVLRSVAAEAGPVDAQTEAVLACLAEVLGKGATDPDMDIRDLGANSLVALRLASVLEGRFGRPVVATDLYRNPTARKIARFLETEVDVPRTVVPIQTGGTKPPFLAVHVLGEKEMLFRPLASALGPDYPVYGLTVGPPSSLSEVTVEGVARRYFEDVQKAFPQGPIALGGVSMAAYFAYELAQLLIAAGRDVRVLAAIDADGPGGRPALRGMRRLGAHMRQFLTHGIDHLAAIARSRIEARREARELANTPPDEVTGLSLVMANVHAVESYQPAPFTRPIAVFRAGDSYWDSDEALRSKLGWEPVARGGLTMVNVPGDHLTLLHAQNVGQMAQHLAMLIGGV
jgi:thioesterase domain-containing protein/acyl carrier protein